MRARLPAEMNEWTGAERVTATFIRWFDALMSRGRLLTWTRRYHRYDFERVMP